MTLQKIWWFFFGPLKLNFRIKFSHAPVLREPVQRGLLNGNVRDLPPFYGFSHLETPR